MIEPHDFLAEAARTLGERGQGYDRGRERSAAKVAEVFNKLTGHSLTEADAWTFLVVLKLVRQRVMPKPDNMVDLLGYGALLAECYASLEGSPVSLCDHLHPATTEATTGAPELGHGNTLETAAGSGLDAVAALYGVTRRHKIGPGRHSKLETDEDLRARVRAAQVSQHPKPPEKAPKRSLPPCRPTRSLEDAGDSALLFYSLLVGLPSDTHMPPKERRARISNIAKREGICLHRNLSMNGHCRDCDAGFVSTITGHRTMNSLCSCGVANDTVVIGTVSGASAYYCIHCHKERPKHS